jgi:hypothetical protein
VKPPVSPETSPSSRRYAAHLRREALDRSHFGPKSGCGTVVTVVVTEEIKSECAHQSGTVGISLAFGICVSACGMHDAYNGGM